ncbi:MAG TPA: type 1 glutamine amidotransferase domain-containing protein [Allosphingosinicella sp.]|jgi:protease I
MPAIADAKILLIATDGFEDSELLETRRLLDEKGAKTTLASPEKKQIKGDNGRTADPDCSVDDVREGDYDLLVLPGGVQNPDKLRMNARVVEIVRAFADAGKPLAAICHGPWLLVEADVVRGRTVTSWPSIRTDLKNAGADVVDREAVTDANIVTSRKPEDIPAFVEAIAALYEKAD